jgi:hypothetical protein
VGEEHALLLGDAASGFWCQMCSRPSDIHTGHITRKPDITGHNIEVRIYEIVIGGRQTYLTYGDISGCILFFEGVQT